MRQLSPGQVQTLGSFWGRDMPELATPDVETLQLSLIMVAVVAVRLAGTGTSSGSNCSPWLRQQQDVLVLARTPVAYPIFTFRWLAIHALVVESSGLRVGLQEFGLVLPLESCSGSMSMVVNGASGLWAVEQLGICCLECAVQMPERILGHSCGYACLRHGIDKCQMKVCPGH